MVRHWNRHLATETDPAERRRMRRAQAINGFGAVMTGVVLVTVLITKFLLGAWIAIAAMAGFYVLMIAIKRHYDHVAAELDDHGRRHRAALAQPRDRAGLAGCTGRRCARIAYARATRPDVLEAVTVNVDDADTRQLVREWDRRKIPVPLKVVESPYREITKPVLDYVKRRADEEPARHRHRVRARVRRRALVGAAPAQPERAADQDPPAVPAGRDGAYRCRGSSSRPSGVVERTELTPGAYRRGYPTAPRDDRPAAPSPSAPRDGAARGSAPKGDAGDRAGAGRPRS